MGGHTKRWSEGYGKRKGSGSGTCWKMTWVAEACGCPGHPAGLGRAVCSGATSCGEKPSDTNKSEKSEVSVQTGCIPEASLKA